MLYKHKYLDLPPHLFHLLTPPPPPKKPKKNQKTKPGNFKQKYVHVYCLNMQLIMLIMHHAGNFGIHYKNLRFFMNDFLGFKL